MGLFSGYFIFVGDIGRPDLLEKSVQIRGSNKLARSNYQSVQRLKIYQTMFKSGRVMGAGSPCGKALGAIPISTIGYEKINNWAFNEIDAD